MSFPVVLGFVLYPAYRAIVVTGRIAARRRGRRIGSVRDRLLRSYLRYLLCVPTFSLAFAVVASMVSGLGCLALRGQVDLSKMSSLRSALRRDWLWSPM